MSRTIVVGVDGSKAATQAFSWACAIGGECDATLQPVLVWEYPAAAMMPFPAGLPIPPEEFMQAEHEALARVVIGLVSPGDGVKVLDPIVVRGGAGRALCHAAAGADLLVVGSRGLGTMRSLVLGSVSSFCGNHAPCPVAVIPRNWGAGSLSSPPKRVVVGVDGSAHSDAAIRWADQWARPEATLVLLHSWDIPVTVDGAALLYRVDDLEEAAHSISDRALEQVSQARRSAGLLEVRTERGDARVLLDEAAETADLVVIGARSHRGLERLLLGSVASYALHHVRVPTVVINDAPD